MHNLRVPSLFLTNNTDAPKWDILILMYFLSNTFCNCILGSNSFGVLIQMGTLDTSATPRMWLIVKSISLFSGNAGT